MQPMTIAEFIKQGDTKGRSIQIEPMMYERPFSVHYYQAGFVSEVALTDLPNEISDLPKASRERSWVAYLTIREQTYSYLFALRSQADYDVINARQKTQRDTMELLFNVMAPKEYLAAIARVNRDMPEIDAGIANKIAKLSEVAA